MFNRTLLLPKRTSSRVKSTAKNRDDLLLAVEDASSDPSRLLLMTCFMVLAQIHVAPRVHYRSKESRRTRTRLRVCFVQPIWRQKKFRSRSLSSAYCLCRVRYTSLVRTRSDRPSSSSTSVRNNNNKPIKAILFVSSRPNVTIDEPRFIEINHRIALCLLRFPIRDSTTRAFLSVCFVASRARRRVALWCTIAVIYHNGWVTTHFHISLLIFYAEGIRLVI